MIITLSKCVISSFSSVLVFTGALPFLIDLALIFYLCLNHHFRMEESKETNFRFTNSNVFSSLFPFKLSLSLISFLSFVVLSRYSYCAGNFM